MTVAVTLAGTAVSLAGLGYLAATDPKRRRAFRLPPVAKRRPRLGWAAALVPGALVAALAGAGSFFVWFGAVTVVGWTLAATRPEAAEATRRALAAAAGRLGERLAALRRPASPDRVAALEARLAALEAEVAALRGDTDAVVVELPLSARR